MLAGSLPHLIDAQKWADREGEIDQVFPLAAFPRVRERCPDAEYFDLRFRGRIYAKQPPPPPAPLPKAESGPKAARPASLRPPPAGSPAPASSSAAAPPLPTPITQSAAAEPPRDDQGR